MAFGGWFRPGGLCAVCPEDVTLPEDVLLMAAGALIRVPPGGRPAKAGSPQPAAISPGPSLHALRALYYGGTEKEPLGVLTVEQYYSAFVRAVRISGLAWLGLTPHSPRARGATEGRHRGMEQPELMRRGRWASRTAMLSYLDQVGARADGLQVPGYARPRIEYQVDHLYEVFPELRWGVLEGESLPTASTIRSILVEGASKRKPPNDAKGSVSSGMVYLNVNDAPRKTPLKQRAK